MKQPKIKIFGNIYKVMQVTYNVDGVISQVVYEVKKDVYNTVYKGDTMINQSLTTERKIQEPTKHPHHNYAHAPNLERLLVK